MFRRKQAPAWNEVTQVFESNPDVVFGDINLSEQQIRGNHNPGAGGWPTVKYFNQETGYEGKPYAKKTDKAMCDELGDIDYMTEYVLEAAGTSLCDISTHQGCSEKEVKFIVKRDAETAESNVAQLDRLNGMKDKPMSVKPSNLYISFQIFKFIFEYYISCFCFLFTCYLFTRFV